MCHTTTTPASCSDEAQQRSRPPDKDEDGGEVRATLPYMICCRPQPKDPHRFSTWTRRIATAPRGIQLSRIPVQSHRRAPPMLPADILSTKRTPFSEKPSRAPGDWTQTLQVLFESDECVSLDRASLDRAVFAKRAFRHSLLPYSTLAPSASPRRTPANARPCKRDESCLLFRRSAGTACLAPQTKTTMITEYSSAVVEATAAVCAASSRPNYPEQPCLAYVSR